MIQVGPYKLRYLDNGTVFIPRPNQIIEKYMDELHVRIGNLQWQLNEVESQPIDDLRPLIKDKICYIIGKGPSLDYICKHHLHKDSCVICINDSVKKMVQLDLDIPIIVIQQDSWLVDKCWFENTHLVVSIEASVNYVDKDFYIFKPYYFGIAEKQITVTWGIQLSKVFGAKRLIMLAFDAMLEGNCDYADCIGYKSSEYSNSNRFLQHKARISKYTDDVELFWINQSTLEKSKDCIPRL